MGTHVELSTSLTASARARYARLAVGTLGTRLANALPEHAQPPQILPLTRRGPYLKRLLGALGAYQIASILQKFLAVLLLPVFTGRIPPEGYGIVETLATFVIFVSIVARFGIIEAFLRYYFVDKDPAKRDALVRRSVLFLLATTTVACIVLVIPAGPLSKLITSEHVPGSFRVAVLGIWSFTNLELAQAVLRVDERLRAYAVTGTINVVVTVAASVVLVVGLDKGYNGLLIANYGTSTLVLFGLWWYLRGRLFPAPGRPEPRASARCSGSVCRPFPPRRPCTR